MGIERGQECRKNDVEEKRSHFGSQSRNLTGP
jgi:hypothetical protein